MSHQDKKRRHRIKCHYGVTDYYKFYKSNAENPVNVSLFRSVFREFLSEMRDMISQEGYVFVLPQRLGKVELRKQKKEVKIDKDGNIINNLNVNWKKTLKLWEENPEYKEKKIKIRYTNEHTDGYAFKIIYSKVTANYKNKTFYTMMINREMRRATEKPIINKKLDAFLLT